MFKFKHYKLQNIILSLLLISGAIKPFLTVLIIDFNITLFMLILTVTDIMFVSKKHIVLDKNKIILILTLITFYFLILISLIYTKSNSYGYFKSATFIINIIYFIYPLFIKKLNLKIIYKTITFIILPTSIWFVIYRYLYWTPAYYHVRLTKDGFYHLTNAYLALGLFLGMGIIMNYFLKYNKLVLLIYIITLIAIGARGPLLLTFILILSYKAFTYWKMIKTRYPLKFSQKTIYIVLISLIASIPLLFYNLNDNGFFKYGIMRLRSFLNFSSDNSSQERIDRFLFSFEHVLDTPFSLFFGHGIGSFGIMYKNLDQREYPHNIYVESLFELGMFGLILIMLLTLTPYLLKRKLLFKLIAIYMLLNAQKTSSLSDLWVLFLFYGILIFNPTVHKRITP